MRRCTKEGPTMEAGVSECTLKSRESQISFRLKSGEPMMWRPLTCSQLHTVTYIRMELSDSCKNGKKIEDIWRRAQWLCEEVLVLCAICAYPLCTFFETNPPNQYHYLVNKILLCPIWPEPARESFLPGFRSLFEVLPSHINSERMGDEEAAPAATQNLGWLLTRSDKHTLPSLQTRICARILEKE